MTRLVCAFALLLCASAGPARAAEAAGADLAALRQLNDDYVKAFLACDVARFQKILADDFSGVLADGRLIDKAEFLRQAKEPPDARGLRLHDVAIRIYGDAAIITAYVTYRRADGTPVRTGYTNLCVRRGGSWAVAWVQWTRIAAP
ncbi:MAG: nuclear transport factor 2 family protein [Opitutaceae bacterium]|jgi:hypothetical protein